MKTARIYTDEQGESHFGKQTYPLHDVGQFGQLSDAEIMPKEPPNSLRMATRGERHTPA
jgi:hypothetical protein